MYFFSQRLSHEVIKQNENSYRKELLENGKTFFMIIVARGTKERRYPIRNKTTIYLHFISKHFCCFFLRLLSLPS